jgi:hypothetical protein
MAATTTIYPDWGRGEHPSAGIRPGRYAEKYIDVRVPKIPANSVVLMATADPVSYFIPYAEPTARYLGIENDFLMLSQGNKLVAEVRRRMGEAGVAKFVVRVEDDAMNDLLAKFGLKLSASPCQPIRSNLEEHKLALCRVEGD